MFVFVLTALIFIYSHSFRYFISSQVKEESARFCQQLTETLQNIRKWETDIVQPYSSEEFDRLILNCK